MEVVKRFNQINISLNLSLIIRNKIKNFKLNYLNSNSNYKKYNNKLMI